MTRYLLDTNIVSDLIRHPQGQAAGRLADLPDDAVCTSVIVAAELRYGAAKKQSPRLTAQLEIVLGALEILSWDQPADQIYGEVRADLERKGRLIGPHDLLIAAHALSLGTTLVTDNEAEFARVARLRIENWLR